MTTKPPSLKRKPRRLTNYTRSQDGLYHKVVTFGQSKSDKDASSYGVVLVRDAAGCLVRTERLANNKHISGSGNDRVVTGVDTTSPLTRAVKDWRQRTR